MPGTESKSAYGGVRGVVLLALLVTAARLVYLWWLCPYALAEDEAFYWEWSLRPDWSYATKGPGIAWAIWGATHVLGTSEGALRTVAAVSGLIGAVAVGGLAGDVCRFGGRDRDNAGRAGLVACALFLLAPVFQGTSLLCTIDAPYVACWAVAAWGAWRALMGESRGAWVVLGAAIGVGFLFKYTILLLPPGVLLFVWLARRELRVSPRAGGAILLGLVLVLLGLLPVVIWNSQHDWQTVRHLMGKVGMAGGDIVRESGSGPAWTPVWMLEFIGGQVAFVGPALLAVAAGAWKVLTRRMGSRGGREQVGGVFLLCCGAPIVVFYLALTLLARAEMNWPIAGWTTLLALAAVWMTDDAQAGTTRRNGGSWHMGGYRRGVMRAAVIVGVLVAAVMARVDVLQKGVALISKDLAAKVPVGRLMAGRPMGADAGRLKEELHRRAGMEPIVICQQYGRASLLRFYMPGRPVVYCASVQTGGRKVQQDYWADTDLNAPALRGKPAVLVGGDAAGAGWKTAFERVEPLGRMLEGDTKKDRPVFFGFGYRGWPLGAH